MITQGTVIKYMRDDKRKRESVNFFNDNINYRAGQPKAVEVIDSDQHSIRLLLDNGEKIWRSWW